MRGNFIGRFSVDSYLDVRVEGILTAMQKNVVVVAQKIRSDVMLHFFNGAGFARGGR